MLAEIQRREGLAVLLITHNLGVVASVADRVMVMYGGDVVESAPVRAFFARPTHPYAEGLLKAMPRVDRVQDWRRSRHGADAAGDAGGLPLPGPLPPGGGALPRAAAAGAAQRGAGPRGALLGEGRMSTTSAPLLEVRDLSKTFTIRRGFPVAKTSLVRALDRVSFTVGRGEALGIVGESGCGKSTTARVALRLTESDGGSVRFDGQDVLAASASAMRRLRRRMQIVFQDPASSLDPRQRIGEALAEPCGSTASEAGRS